MLSLLLLSLLTKLSIEILYFYLAFTECKSKGEILYSSVSDKTAKGRRLSSPWSPSAWSAKNVLRGGDQKKTEVLFMPKTESWFGTASFTKKVWLYKKKRGSLLGRVLALQQDLKLRSGRHSVEFSEERSDRTSANDNQINHKMI